MELLRVLIGPALRRERRAQGRTLKDVADAARVSITHLSEVERGRKEVSSEVLEAICGALGLGVVDLLETIVVETRAAQRPLLLRSLLAAGTRPADGRTAPPAATRYAVADRHAAGAGPAVGAPPAVVGPPAVATRPDVVVPPAVPASPEVLDPECRRADCVAA